MQYTHNTYLVSLSKLIISVANNQTKNWIPSLPALMLTIKPARTLMLTIMRTNCNQKKGLLK